MFSWCANSEGARKGHLCVFSCVSAARRCVWTSSHRTSSCKQKVAPLNASAGVLAGAMSFHILSHSPQCGRCAASSSPCWILWETRVGAVRVLMCLFILDEDSERKAPVRLTHLPPDSLQLGQVHATLRSLLPSWPNWSSSSTSLTRRCDRSLVFRVESVLSCQSPASGSSFIRISEINVYVNIKTSSSKLPKKPAQWELLYYCVWLTAWQQISKVKLHIKHSDQIISWLTENVLMTALIINETYPVDVLAHMSGRKWMKGLKKPSAQCFDSYTYIKMKPTMFTMKAPIVQINYQQKNTKPLRHIASKL